MPVVLLTDVFTMTLKTDRAAAVAETARVLAVLGAHVRTISFEDFKETLLSIAIVPAGRVAVNGGEVPIVRWWFVCCIMLA